MEGNNNVVKKNDGLKRFNNAICLSQTSEYLSRVLGSNAEAFTTSVVSLVANSTTLQNCEPFSVMYAALKAATLNLPLDDSLGLAYVIPYKKNDECFAQFQIGYKGLIQLCIRSGMFTRINVTDVREGELKKNDLLTGDIVIEMAESRDALPVIGYCGFFRLTNGFEKAEYWTKEKVEKHADEYSATYRNKRGLWVDKFEMMAKKTVLKMLLKRYAPLSVTLQSAIAADQAVFREPDEPTYVDNFLSSERIQEIAEEAIIKNSEGEAKNEKF